MHIFCYADNYSSSRRAKLIHHIETCYPDQFTNPQHKKRHTFSQFGYDLSEFRIQLFPISKFIKPGKYGYQSYGRPNRQLEKNGSLYTCRGGFIDFSHMREAIDWTVFIAFKILTEHNNFELPGEAGKLNLHFSDIEKLPVEDIAAMAQKIAFERLTWHEIASWHYHKPYKMFSEQQSTFTPEDNYSNLLGTLIGRNVALRMLSDSSQLSYSELAAEEINNMINTLEPVASKEQTRMAYDIVDQSKQLKLPKEECNTDVWYSSDIVFRDQRYAFKRSLQMGPAVTPWLVPTEERVGCPTGQAKGPMVLQVPEVTRAGVNLYQYYEFSIVPDSNLFYDYKYNVELHPSFGAFNTTQMGLIVDHVRKQMAAVLMPGFDSRDGADPTTQYANLRRVILRLR